MQVKRCHLGLWSKTILSMRKWIPRMNKLLVRVLRVETLIINPIKDLKLRFFRIFRWFEGGADRLMALWASISKSKVL